MPAQDIPCEIQQGREDKKSKSEQIVEGARLPTGSLKLTRKK